MNKIHKNRFIVNPFTRYISTYLHNTNIYNLTIIDNNYTEKDAVIHRKIREDYSIQIHLDCINRQQHYHKNGIKIM